MPCHEKIPARKIQYRNQVVTRSQTIDFHWAVHFRVEKRLSCSWLTPNVNGRRTTFCHPVIYLAEELLDEGRQDAPNVDHFLLPESHHQIRHRNHRS